MTLVDWRLEVLLEPERSGKTVTEVCVRNEISRDTFYRWRRRLEAAGWAGLLDRSRVPIRQPGRIDAGLEDAICALRRQNPRWGAKTIRARMMRAGVETPSVATIHRVLKRNGLVTSSPRKRPRATLHRFEREFPNDLWQMDAKRFVCADGTEAYVVDVLDDHARFCLAAVVSDSPDAEAVWAAFTAAAHAYGLPRQVLTDNHSSFTGRLKGVEVDFERKLRALDVSLIHGRPGHPQTQGKIERFHRTLDDFVIDHGGARDRAHLQALVDECRRDYNIERPHQSLDDATPAERYRPSELVFNPATIPEPTYDDDAIVRKVSGNGTICFNYLIIGVGRRWAGTRVRIDPGPDAIRIFHGGELVRSLVPDLTRRSQRRSRTMAG